MSDETITFLVLGAVVAVFVWDRLPVAVVAVGVALSLWATGVLSLEQALAGFGDPTVIFIAALFVVSEALDATGVTTWAGQQLITRAGDSQKRVLVLMMLLCAGLTALITVNGSVAALVPVVVLMALRLRREPSQLLMPLAFSAHAGSLLVLTASPVNVIVSEAADDAGVGRIGYFDFALVGIPLLAGTIAIVVLLGDRLLPAPDAALGADGLQLARPDARPPVRARRPGRVAHAGTRSGGGGDPAAVRARRPGRLRRDGDRERRPRRARRPAQGTGARGRDDARGRRHAAPAGSWGALDEHLDDADVLLVDRPELVRRQAVPLGPGARRAVLVLAAMVVLLATGAVPPAVAGLLAAGALVVTGVLSIEQAYRGIGWTTVILVAGMIPLATAMTATGAAEALADGLVDVVGDAGPRALLLGLVLLVFVLGQLISNMATALIVIPIAVSAAAELDVSAKPLLVGVAVAAAAAFLTPVATPANLMVMGPGGYRFGDYWKLGLPLLALFGVVAVLLVPVFWSF